MNKRDAIALIITFLAVLAIGIENGILVGAVTSLVLFIRTDQQPALRHRRPAAG